MIAPLVFIFGLIVGSFLSVVFTRLEGTESKTKKSRRGPSGHAPQMTKAEWRGIVTGRSRCDHCKRPIAWYDNIPLVSYMLLRGRCRHCHKPINYYHPILELSAGLSVLAAYLAYGISWQFLVGGVFGVIMLLVFAYDLRHQIIPNAVVVPGIVLALVAILYEFILFRDGQALAVGLWSTDPDSYLLGGGVLGLFFLALSVLSKGAWIGGGDIKLGTLIGLVLGWPAALVALVLAYFIGTLYAAVLLVSKQATLKTYVPFGPMLVLGYFVAAYYGADIVRWYQGLVI